MMQPLTIDIPHIISEGVQEFKAPIPSRQPYNFVGETPSRETVRPDLITVFTLAKNNRPNVIVDAFYRGIFARTSTLVPDLVKVLPRGTMVQHYVSLGLKKLLEAGLLSYVSDGDVSSRSVHFNVVVSASHWNSESRQRIHEFALDMQDKYDVLVQVDLQREKTRAQHP